MKKKILYWIGSRPLKKKLLFVFTFTILSIGVMSFFSLNSVFHYINDTNQQNKRYINISNTQKEINNNTYLLKKYLDEGIESDLQKFNQSVDEIQSLFDEEFENEESMDSYLLRRAINKAFWSYYDEGINAIRLKSKGDSDYYTYFYKAKRIYQYLDEYINQYMELSLKEGNQRVIGSIEKANNMRVYTFVGIGGISILCLLFSIFFSNYVTKYIKQLLTHTIQIAKGNLEIEGEVSSYGDEVGQLTRSFNMMSRSMKEKIDDLNNKADIEKRLHEEELKNMEMKELVREADFLSLQSQINPHFLFNTLNNIGRTAMFEEAEQTMELIQALAELFRYTLQQNTKCTTLDKEVEMIEKYFYIQKYRFKERLKYEIDIKDLSVKEIKTPAFLLQPIVENAISHGLEEKEEGGNIKIIIRMRNEVVWIIVKDDGVGMDQSQIDKLMSDENQKEPGRRKSIGIHNVKNRIRLFNKGREGFLIRSHVNKGTMVLMKIRQ
ncbi:sensor histidine kinase [Clostridium sp. DL1XJH146]